MRDTTGIASLTAICRESVQEALIRQPDMPSTILAAELAGELRDREIERH
jgi:hypothetical protein